MQIDIKTRSIKPLRNTFGHLERRFGDKVASRYQEATYDIQSESNFHYKPLWDAARDMYDRRRTAITMRDWYALKDPRQFYYGSYTIARARWQEGVDRQVDFVEKRGLLRNLAAEQKERIVSALVPLRHYEWGANTNNAHVSAYGFGVAITQAALMCTMDRLAMAQHVSRIGLLTDGSTGKSLVQAKRAWLDAPEWQALRREVETLFVTRDWFEVFVAQNLVADALIYPLFFQHVDAELAAACGSAVSLMTESLMRWYEETGKWVDAVVKTAAQENEANRSLLAAWIARWRDSLAAAVRPLAAAYLQGDAQATVTRLLADLDARTARLGIDR